MEIIGIIAENQNKKYWAGHISDEIMQAIAKYTAKCNPECHECLVWRELEAEKLSHSHLTLEEVAKCSVCGKLSDAK